MNDSPPPICLVILAGGQSKRMGRDKAILEFDGTRLIDLAVGRFQEQTQTTLLSASTDFGTGLKYIPDDPDAPGGPVGAVFSVAARLKEVSPKNTGFMTIPVDAPFAPGDLVSRLFDPETCTVASGPKRLHPTFAYWRSDVVNAVRGTHDFGDRAPSLQWLTRQCDAKPIQWPDERPFININTPEDLAAATSQK